MRTAEGSLVRVAREPPRIQKKVAGGSNPAGHSKQTTQGCGWCLGSDSGPLPIGFNPRALHHRPQTKLPRATPGCWSHIVRARDVQHANWLRQRCGCIFWLYVAKVDYFLQLRLCWSIGFLGTAHPRAPESRPFGVISSSYWSRFPFIPGTIDPV